MLSSWLDFTLWALAVWRVAHLLVHEDGPWAVFARLRMHAGIGYVVRQDAEGRPTSMKVARGTLAEALTCVWCVSVWGALLAALLAWSPYGHQIVLTARDILAVSAGVCILHEGVTRLRDGAG